MCIIITRVILIKILQDTVTVSCWFFSLCLIILVPFFMQLYFLHTLGSVELGALDNIRMRLPDIIHALKPVLAIYPSFQRKLSSDLLRDVQFAYKMKSGVSISLTSSPAWGNWVPVAWEGDRADSIIPPGLQTCGRNRSNLVKLLLAFLKNSYFKA